LGVAQQKPLMQEDPPHPQVTLPPHPSERVPH
jgi:hypothetical protein